MAWIVANGYRHDANSYDRKEEIVIVGAIECEDLLRWTLDLCHGIQSMDAVSSSSDQIMVDGRTSMVEGTVA